MEGMNGILKGKEEREGRGNKDDEKGGAEKMKRKRMKKGRKEKLGRREVREGRDEERKGK
jgi:hypothetical protein